MKTKPCAVCARQAGLAYRIQLAPAVAWVFVCAPCLPTEQAKPGYRYGGTWKGARHGNTSRTASKR